MGFYIQFSGFLTRFCEEGGDWGIVIISECLVSLEFAIISNTVSYHQEKDILANFPTQLFKDDLTSLNQAQLESVSTQTAALITRASNIE